MARDYYEILSVERTVDAAGLKASFRKLAMQHHPDRNPGDAGAEAKFKELNEAYSILADPQKRAAYDRYGHAGVNGGANGFAGQGDINDIFSSVFGEAFGDMFARGRGGPSRGADLRYDLEITLEEAYAGAQKEVTIPSTAPCETCDGSGAKPGTKPATCMQCGGMGRVRATQGFFSVERACPRCGGSGQRITDPCTTCHGHGQVRRERTLDVRIPPGVDDGARIRLSGEGDAGSKGGPKGDLYIFLSVAPHELFERDGLDLLCTVPVPMWEAALGGEIEAPCIVAADCDSGGRLKVKVPEGAQTGRTIRLKGRGMPSLRGREKGDLVVELYVETPTRLTAKQKSLLKELGETTTAEQHPQHAGFFGKAKRFWEGLTGADAR